MLDVNGRSSACILQREFDSSASVRPAARPENASSQAAQQQQQQQQPPRPLSLYPQLYPSLSMELRADEMPVSRLGLGDGQPGSRSSTESAASASSALQLEQPQTQTLSDSLVGAIGEPTRAANKATCSDVSLSDPPSLVEQASVCNAAYDKATDASRWFDDSSFHYRGPILRIQFKKLDPSLALVCHSPLYNLGFLLLFILVHHLTNHISCWFIQCILEHMHRMQNTVLHSAYTPLSI